MLDTNRRYFTLLFSVAGYIVGKHAKTVHDILCHVTIVGRSYILLMSFLTIITTLALLAQWLMALLAQRWLATVNQSWVVGWTWKNALGHFANCCPVKYCKIQPWFSTLVHRESQWLAYYVTYRVDISPIASLILQVVKMCEIWLKFGLWKTKNEKQNKRWSYTQMIKCCT